MAYKLSIQVFRWLFRFITGQRHPRRVRISSSRHLRETFELMGSEAPSRRVQQQEHQDYLEWNSLREFLYRLDEHALLRYPISVAKGESPDFMLLWPDGTRTGLELRRVRTGLHGALETPQGAPLTVKIPKHPVQGRPMEPSLGDQVAQAIGDKLAKMARPGKWRWADRQDLLLHEVQGADPESGYSAPVAELWQDAEALPRQIKNQINHTVQIPEQLPCGAFGSVSLMLGSRVLHDLLGTPRILAPAGGPEGNSAGFPPPPPSLE
ncbi:MAG: hypothetical protein OEW39_10520 [Deltaproteobacteria bacterium]|nr:hypothetical protein [Deltaproteobacteria bacterium]